MAKIKYAENIEPLINKHYGFTFQPHAGGYSMFPEQKNDRKRYPQQWKRQQCNQAAINAWRQASGNVKAAWSDFAADFPEPTKSDPNKFLTGYQLFIKRMFYDFLHEGFQAPIITEPRLEKLDAPGFKIEIADTGLCINMTEEYIINFGILPKPGQFIILRILPMAIESAQFFEPFAATVEVKAIYYDALICSFDFINPPAGIVFSLYASKPYYESNQYQGTKFRYMGCFKPTTFLKLLDTPSTYEGQKGKIVAVNEEEKALIFIDPPEPTPGTDSDEKVKINAADPAAGYLQDKIKAGENVSITPGTGADANKLIIAAENNGENYSWNIHSPAEIIGYLPEPEGLNFSTNGSILFETLPAGTYVLTALNENGETTPSAFGEIKVYSDTTEQIFSWDAVEGATGYILYKILDAVAVSGLQVDATILEFDLLNPPDHEDLIEPVEPSENTAAIFQSPFTIDNADTVEFTAENAEIETSIDENDSTKKQVKIIVPQVISEFIKLFDTPSTYEEQKGKLLAVNEDESAVIFTSPPLPPVFDCSVLFDCPLIVQILSNISALNEDAADGKDISFPPINFGIYYNHFCITSGKALLRPGWDIFTYEQFRALANYVGTLDTAGGLLKETGLVYWANPNTGATNAFGFNARGSGYRQNTGIYSSLRSSGIFWCKDSYSPTSARAIQVSYSSTKLSGAGNNYQYGRSLRPFRPAPGQPDGKTGKYNCFNGRIIRTIVINEQEILADNLVETVFSDGSPIPNNLSDSEWFETSTPAISPPAGNWNNV